MAIPRSHILGKGEGYMNDMWRNLTGWGERPHEKGNMLVSSFESLAHKISPLPTCSVFLW